MIQEGLTLKLARARKAMQQAIDALAPPHSSPDPKSPEGRAMTILRVSLIENPMPAGAEVPE